MMPLYLKLFNKILDSGAIPEAWTLGNILPFFKNKGDRTPLIMTHIEELL